MNLGKAITATAIIQIVFVLSIFFVLNAGMAPDNQHKDLNQLWDDGLKVRREVIGNDYVERSLNNATDYTKPMQELVTEWVWGNIWTRPGLDRKQKSLLVMAVSIAQKDWHELSLHTRGAINNGLTETEIREAVLTSTVYCGVPAGLEAIKVTEKTINDMIEKGEYKRS